MAYLLIYVPYHYMKSKEPLDNATHDIVLHLLTLSAFVP